MSTAASTIELHYEHLSEHISVVDKKRWKKIKESEDVYKERKPRFDLSPNTASESSESAADTSEDVKSMASLLAFGSIPGNLDDVMHGMLSPSTEEMQLRAACTGNGARD